MHRALAVWFLANPWRAVLAAVVFGLASLFGLTFMSLPAGAVAVLMTLGLDARWGVRTAFAGAVGVGAILVASGQSMALTLGWVVTTFVAPLCLALIAQRTGSLRACFQAAVLVALLVIVAIYVGMDDAEGRWRLLVTEWMHVFSSQLTQMGMTVDEKAIESLFASTNWGTLVTECWLTAQSSMFLGCWWQSQAQSPGAFGSEFRQLRLGNVLGVVSVTTIVAAFALDKFGVTASIVSAALWVAVIALAIQGLAAAHRFKANGRISGVWLVALYGLLIFAAPIVLMVLAGWGVADNWRKPA